MSWSKLDKLEERFALGDTDRQIFFEKIEQKPEIEIASAKDAMKFFHIRIIEPGIFDRSFTWNHLKSLWFLGFREIIHHKHSYKKGSFPVGFYSTGNTIIIELLEWIRFLRYALSQII